MANITGTVKWVANKMAGTPDSIQCVIDGRHCCVPTDPANTDYQAIQEWVAEGNTIEEAD